MQLVQKDSGILNIRPQPGRAEGEFLVNYLSQNRCELNLVVTSSGKIVLSRPLKVKSGLNVYSLDLKHLKGADVVVSLLDTHEVISGRIKL